MDRWVDWNSKETLRHFVDRMYEQGLCPFEIELYSKDWVDLFRSYHFRLPLSRKEIHAWRTWVELFWEDYPGASPTQENLLAWNKAKVFYGSNAFRLFFSPI